MRKPGLVLSPAGALPLPARIAYAGAFLSGLLYSACFADDVWPLAFVAHQVPLVVAMHRQTKPDARRSWLAGLAPR